jgi:hypothetical protein
MQSDLLDSVIGVVFTWFLFSTVLSVANEGFALLTRARAKHLWLGIGKIIDPAKARLSSGFLDTLIKLPFTSRLDARPVVPPDPEASGRGKGDAANQPDAAKLARDSAERGPASRNVKGLRASTQKLYDELSAHVVEIAKPGRLSKISRVAAGSFSDAVLAVARNNVYEADLLAAAADSGWSPARQSELHAALAVEGDKALEFDDIIRHAGPDIATHDELRNLYQEASTTLTGRDVADFFKENPTLALAVRRAAGAVRVEERSAAVKKVVESWFEREMDQLSAFYRRQSRKILGVLAVPLVLFCHANTIAIFDNLRHDASLRQATLNAAIATSASESPEKAMNADCTPVNEPTTATSATTATTASATTTSIARAPLAVATTATTTAAPPAHTPTTGGATTTTTDPIREATNRLKCATTIIDKASSFRVGLAWHDLITAHGARDKHARLERADLKPYLGHALRDDWGAVGRLITLLALLFGAQFWFDVLRRLTGLRGAATRTGNRAGPDSSA